jgi:hypothetical protein
VSDEHLVLLRQARDTIDSYLFDYREPSYSEALDLCGRIDEALREGACTVGSLAAADHQHSGTSF